MFSRNDINLTTNGVQTINLQNACCYDNVLILTKKTTEIELDQLIHQFAVIYNKISELEKHKNKNTNFLNEIKSFLKTHEFSFPNLKIPFVILSTDWKYLLNPFHMEIICNILEINLSAEEFYGSEKFFEIKNKYSTKNYSILFPQYNKFMDYNFRIPELQEKFPLIEQQKELKNRVHYVNSGGDENTIIISTDSIDHNTAKLLYEYYRIIEIKQHYLGYHANFIHFYDGNNCLDLLENNYIENQKFNFKKINN